MTLIVNAAFMDVLFNYYKLHYDKMFDFSESVFAFLVISLEERPNNR